MAAMKPRTGDGPLEVTKEGRGIVMRVPLEGGGRLVVEGGDRHRQPQRRHEAARRRQAEPSRPHEGVEIEEVERLKRRHPEPPGRGAAVAEHGRLEAGAAGCVGKGKPLEFAVGREPCRLRRAGDERRHPGNRDAGGWGRGGCGIPGGRHELGIAPLEAQVTRGPVPKLQVEQPPASI